ncbi:hypothetical protein M0G74_10960 [Microbulbifer sp. CAU 1566]|uniref:hypothetical protein n=1 Tax=Microbulbifer sp. CAU 1566 TaxID=2933269 RepID=UPI002003D6E3|nr:hypothetical protein [Microbulbifer sp. CAU 1566]MCK7597789.1 hypothetical protein [Microbulbifer sp. CAU 1566]
MTTDEARLSRELKRVNHLVKDLKEELEHTCSVAAQRLQLIQTLRQPKPEVVGAANMLRDALFDLGPTGQYRDMEAAGRAGHLQTTAKLALELLQEAGR